MTSLRRWTESGSKPGEEKWVSILGGGTSLCKGPEAERSLKNRQALTQCKDPIYGDKA